MRLLIWPVPLTFGISSYSSCGCLWLTGTIVSIGDPKKKYTRYEKIGQGWVKILLMFIWMCSNGIVKLFLYQQNLVASWVQTQCTCMGLTLLNVMTRNFHSSLHRTFFIVLCSVKVLVSRHCETQSCDVLHTCIWCFGLLHRNKVLGHMAATITGTTTEEVLSASSVFISVDRLSPWWQHILQDTVVKLTRCVVEIEMTAQPEHGCRPACNNEYWAFNSWNISWCNVFEHGLYFDCTVSLNVHWGKLVLLSGQGIRDCVHCHRCCHRTRGKWWVVGIFRLVWSC